MCYILSISVCYAPVFYPPSIDMSFCLLIPLMLCHLYPDVLYSHLSLYVLWDFIYIYICNYISKVWQCGSDTSVSAIKASSVMFYALLTINKNKMIKYIHIYQIHQHLINICLDTKNLLYYETLYIYIYLYTITSHKFTSKHKYISHSALRLQM